MTMEVHRNANNPQPYRQRENLGKVRIAASDGAVGLWFFEPKGFGLSRYDLSVDSGSFEILAQAMIHANRDAAIKAFGVALQADVPEPLAEWYPAA